MRRINCIPDSVECIYCDCISHFRKPKREALKKYADKVKVASEDFRKHIPNNFSAFSCEDVPEEDCESLISVYEDKFVAIREMLKKDYYSEILQSANGNCPYCESYPRTIDHFLPKSEYSLLSVEPMNLIPCCRDCNSNKMEYVPKNDCDVLIHPYYDDIRSIWLNAILVFSSDYSNVDIQYGVGHIEDAKLERRLKNTFNVLKLQDTFSSQARTHLFNMRGVFSSTYSISGKIGLSQFIDGIMISSDNRDVNSWQSALYRAIGTQLDDVVDWCIK